MNPMSHPTQYSTLNVAFEKSEFEKCDLSGIARAKKTLDSLMILSDQLDLIAQAVQRHRQAS